MANAQVTGTPPSDPPKEPSKSDTDTLKSLFLAEFNHPRNSEQNITLKNQSRTFVLDHFKSLGLETFTHEFVIKHRSAPSSLISSALASEGKEDTSKDATETGINLIGILPSRIRASGSNASEHLMVIAAHYDTVSKCPGIDDNGSGSVTTLTCASLFTQFVKDRGYLYESTSILFVLFDLEEKVRRFLPIISIVRWYVLWQGHWLTDNRMFPHYVYLLPNLSLSRAYLFD